MDYRHVKEKLKITTNSWLVTGVAGFIGSHLLENLLTLNQKVIGLDNFSTGFQANLNDVRKRVGEKAWSNFNFISADIRDLDACNLACKGVDFVLHQAALGSVPRSIKDPLSTHKNNVDGFLNILLAARDAQVKRFVFASSSSVYGDNKDLPKTEDVIGSPLSPYALSKYTNELYAKNFANVYGLNYVGLRYFNVFGRRQNPEGAYAAVIPKWMSAMINDEIVYINGDGNISRDFCFIDNVVQANILAAMTTNSQALNRIYNVACHNSTTLNKLFDILREALEKEDIFYEKFPVYREERAGDIKHSFASIDSIVSFLQYQPLYNISEGISILVKWFVENQRQLELSGLSYE